MSLFFVKPCLTIRLEEYRVYNNFNATLTCLLLCCEIYYSRKNGERRSTVDSSSSLSFAFRKVYRERIIFSPCFFPTGKSGKLPILLRRH